MSQGTPEPLINYASRGATVRMKRSRLTLAALIIASFPPAVLVGSYLAESLVKYVSDMNLYAAFVLASVVAFACWPVGLVVGILASLRETEFGLPQVGIVALSITTPLMVVLFFLLD
jgi:hypothetical protein